MTSGNSQTVARLAGNVHREMNLSDWHQYFSSIIVRVYCLHSLIRSLFLDRHHRVHISITDENKARRALPLFCSLTQHLINKK